MYAEFLENRRSPLHGQLSARRVEYKHHRSVKSRARCEAAGRVNRGVKRTIAAAGRQRGARQLRRVRVEPRHWRGCVPVTGTHRVHAR
eukprot:scaffold81887_cov45-Phaeocystis_antarctica.AAC.2